MTPRAGPPPTWRAWRNGWGAPAPRPLLVARDAQTARVLCALFAQRLVEKRYLALTAGTPPTSRELLLDAPLARRGKRAVTVGPDAAPGPGRAAVTRGWVVAEGRGVVLWMVAPESGRFHQVRAHMTSAGFPVVGDWRYGQRSDICLGLHAFGLRFRHPSTAATVVVVAPPHPEFLRLAARHGLPAGWELRVADATRWNGPP